MQFKLSESSFPPAAASIGNRHPLVGILPLIAACLTMCAVSGFDFLAYWGISPVNAGTAAAFRLSGGLSVDPRSTCDGKGIIAVTIFPGILGRHG